MAYFRFPPIPIATSGLATEAKQDDIITELGIIEENTSPLDVVDQLDTGVLDASSNTIPQSSNGTPLTVVATLAADVKAILPDDTTGYYLGLYSDPAGTPVLEAIIGPGADYQIPVNLPMGTVLGLRHMFDTDITLGQISINFLG